MATNDIDIAFEQLITPSPTPMQSLYARQDSTKKFEYPACRDDAEGPCMLSDSSSEACKREFMTISGLSYHHQYYCMCTNGYYERSSE